MFPEAVVLSGSVENVFLEISQNSQQNICARVSFLKKLQAVGTGFWYSESLAQLFSCKFSEIYMNTFFYRTPLVTASVFPNTIVFMFLNKNFIVC